MIFVTVGTHEQPFNRLIQKIDELILDGTIQEEVFIQTGYSTYVPKNCKWSKLIPYTEMIKKIKAARIIITHGGPASFIMSIQMGKKPIVVPRQKQFNEHVNDHQVEFSKVISERMEMIFLVINIEELGNMILQYDKITLCNGKEIISNNDNFIEAFEKIVKQLIE